MFTVKDFSAVSGYVSGRELLPHDSSKNFDINASSSEGLTKPFSLDLSKLLEDPMLARKRFVKGEFDARDTLVSVWRGSRGNTFTVGRKWKYTNGNLRFQFSPSFPWGENAIAVIPAVASLATRDVDKGSITAWGHLHQVLSVAGNPGPIDMELMASLNRTHGASVNCVRFIHRLAALYLHTMSVGGEGKVTIELRQQPTVSVMNSVNQLNANLNSARGGRQFIPWHDYGSVDNANVLRVLYTAGCGKIVGVGGDTSRCLHFWPDLGGSIEVTTDSVAITNALRALHFVELDSAQVWFAATRWIAKYSDLALWDEALDVVGANCISPCGRSVITMDSKVDMCLPLSSMGPLGLGPLLQPQLDASLGDMPREPKAGILAERHFVIALLLGLLHWHTQWKVVGWYYHHELCNDRDANEYWRRFHRTNHHSGAWAVINHNIQHWAPGSIGRVFSTIMGRDIQRWKKLAALSKYAPQWDEIVSRSRIVLSDSAIYGLIYPLRPTTETFPRSRWTMVESIPAARSMEHAYYSVLMHKPKVAIRIDNTGITSKVVPHRPTISYRGVESDYSVTSGLTKEGFAFKPIFMLSDKNEYYHLIMPDSVKYELRWFVEAPDDTLVTHNVLVDIVAPPAPIDTYIHASLDSESEDDNESEDDESSKYSSLIEGSSVGGDTPVENLEKALDRGLDTESKPEKSKHVPLVEMLPSWAKGEVSDDKDPRYLVQKVISTIDEPDFKDLPTDMRTFHNDVFSIVKNSTSEPPVLGPVLQLYHDGMPAAGQASGNFDKVLVSDIYDNLKVVGVKDRARVADAYSNIMATLLRDTPAGTSTNVMVKKTAAWKAAAKAMDSCPALEAEELPDLIALGPLQKLGLATETEIFDRKTGTMRKVLKPELSGRVPEPEVLRSLINGGFTILEGVGAKLRGAPVTEAEVAQNTIAELAEVILGSALEAGVVPTLDTIIDIVTDANAATGIFEAWAAANAKQLNDVWLHLKAERSATNTGASESGSNIHSSPSSESGQDAGALDPVTMSWKEVLLGRRIQTTEPSGKQLAAAARLKSRSKKLPTLQEMVESESGVTGTNTQPERSAVSADTTHGKSQIQSDTLQSGELPPASSYPGLEGAGEEPFRATFVDPMPLSSGSNH